MLSPRANSDRLRASTRKSSNPVSMCNSQRLHLPVTMSLKHEIRLPVLTTAYVSRIQNESLQRIKNGFVGLRKHPGGYLERLGRSPTRGLETAVPVSDVITSLTQDLVEEFITRVCMEITISMDQLLTEMGVKKISPQPAGAVPLTATLTTSMLSNTATMSGPGLSLHQSPSRKMQRARSYHQIPARIK